MTKSPFTNQQSTKSILIPTFSSITLVDPNEITYVHAMQNYCMVYKQDGTHMLSSISFGKVTELLEFHGFYQCHKSYAIHLKKVVRYLKNGKAELVGDVIIPVARRRKKEFMEVMNAGIYRSPDFLTVGH